MYITILGILENGQTRRPDVDVNNTQQIRITRNASTRIAMDAIYPDGTPIDASTPGATFTLSITQNSYSEFAQIQITGVPDPSAGVGRVNFDVTPEMTRFVQPGRYVYDVWMVTTGNIRNALVPLSPIILQPTATY